MVFPFALSPDLALGYVIIEYELSDHAEIDAVQRKKLELEGLKETQTQK